MTAAWLLLATGIGVGKNFEVPPVVSNVAIKDTFASSGSSARDPDQDDYHQFHFAAILGSKLVSQILS